MEKKLGRYAKCNFNLSLFSKTVINFISTVLNVLCLGMPQAK